MEQGLTHEKNQKGGSYAQFRPRQRKRSTLALALARLERRRRFEAFTPPSPRYGIGSVARWNGGVEGSMTDWIGEDFQRASCEEAGQMLMRRWPSSLAGPNDLREHARGLGIESDEARVYWVELGLSMLCARSHPGALLTLESNYLRPIGRSLLARELRSDFCAEVLQLVRVRLLIGLEPRIGRYAGHCPLGGWIHVCAMRTAKNLHRRERRQRTTDWHERPTPEPDDPSDWCYQTEAEDALREALCHLPPNSLKLLQLQRDGASVDRIGSMFGVHRAAAAPRLARIRSQLLASVAARLAQRFHIRQSEAVNVLRELAPALDISPLRVMDVAAIELSESRRAVPSANLQLVAE